MAVPGTRLCLVHSAAGHCRGSYICRTQPSGSVAAGHRSVCESVFGIQTRRTLPEVVGATEYCQRQMSRI